MRLAKVWFPITDKQIHDQTPGVPGLKGPARVSQGGGGWKYWEYFSACLCSGMADRHPRHEPNLQIASIYQKKHITRTARALLMCFMQH